MATAAQRITDLEQQVADLTARVEQVAQEAAMVRMFSEVRRDAHAAIALRTSRPRHLHAVNGGAR
jgi:hypothetical protein